jgi:KipI family sensor histidine kinase inhibitor
MTRVLPYGDRALLVEAESLDEVLALYPALQAARVTGIGEIVPASRTILVTVNPALLSLRAAERWIGTVAADPAPPADDGPLIVVPVTYDGEDLDQVARLLGETREGVIRIHTSMSWTVAFIGFSPGFAFLASAEHSLDLPRRETPRPRVPAGSVGLAGEFSGIYPHSSRGSWQLIGRTSAVIWDETRQSPALLVPGTRVRFVDAEAPAGMAAPAGDAVGPADGAPGTGGPVVNG